MEPENNANVAEPRLGGVNVSTPEECVSGDYALSLDSQEPKRVLSGFSATMIVVASMIGTGVFGTTGLLLTSNASPLAVLCLWIVGGTAAFCGAISYAELVAMYPRNGGEYQILSRIFHPSVGFVAGWISLIVGFSAPIASTAMLFSKYVGAAIGFSDLHFSVAGMDVSFDGSPLSSATHFWIAFSVIAIFSIIHAIKVTLGSAVQNFLTVIKLILVIGFIAGGFYLGDFTHLTTHASDFSGKMMLTPGFAVGLILVTYAYTGWNGSVYIAGEVKNPSKSLPKALAIGTGLVTLIYLVINIVFLISAPVEKLAGCEEIGAVAALSLFGQGIGNIFSLVIAFLLLSSLSATIMTGPRIYQSIGEDYPLFKGLMKRSGNSGPFWAIGLQAVIATVMILTARFDQLIMYMGFTLSITSALTVIGVFIMRRRKPDAVRPYKCWGYPVTPIIFILLAVWMVVFTIIDNPYVAIFGAVTIISGFLLYFFAKYWDFSRVCRFFRRRFQKPGKEKEKP